MDELNKLEEIESEFKQNKKIKKIIGIFLFLLIISYFLLSQAVFPLIESMAESRSSVNNTIYVNPSMSIIFKGETYGALQKIYFENTSVEFVVCLFGEKKINNYIISELFIPEIIDQSFNHVSFKSCPKETIILLHSHPYRRCIASNQDLKTLEFLKNNNNHSLIMIMCDENRFSTYS
jgi:hypothetical protein